MWVRMKLIRLTASRSSPYCVLLQRTRQHPAVLLILYCFNGHDSIPQFSLLLCIASTDTTASRSSPYFVLLQRTRQHSMQNAWPWSFARSHACVSASERSRTPARSRIICSRRVNNTCRRANNCFALIDARIINVQYGGIFTQQMLWFRFRF